MRLSSPTHDTGVVTRHDDDMTDMFARTGSPESRPPLPNAPAVAASRGQLEWLRRQVLAWQNDGTVDAAQASAILSRYDESRRFSIGRILLTLGAGFVGVGLIWLVAANLDQFSPLTRFVAMTALWLGLLIGGEVAHTRHAPPLMVGALRLMAAFAIGGVIFQAAQSLQVPAYEHSLVGLWGVAALLQAYLLASYLPLFIGIAGVTYWSIAQSLTDDTSFATVVLVLSASAVVALGIAALHERWRREYGAVWRNVGAALTLVVLFAAAIPLDEEFEITWAWWPIAVLALSGVAVVGAAALRSTSRSHSSLAALETLGAVGILAIAVGMAAWNPGNDFSTVGPEDWLHSIVAVIAYVLLALGVAVVGTLRDSRTLTAISTLALVVFTTFQSFAVFAEVIEGAWLFLVLGLVFLATGIGFDRTRRRLAESLDDDVDPTPTPSIGA